MRVSHRAGRLLLAGFGVAAMFTVLIAVPAAAQIGPTPGPDCEEGSETERECREDDDGEGNGEQVGQGGECTFRGFEVNCFEPGYGSWVGSPDLLIAPGSPVFSTPAAPPLEGCYAQPSGDPWAGNPPPDDADPDAEGYWAELSCFGEVPPVMPPQSSAAAVWLPGAAAGPDPEQLARRALASIDLRAPQLLLSPPASGSVPLGMPVWLAVAETGAAWGPISSGPVCEQGLCVEVTATAERVEWRMGDGNQVSCTRQQNTPWQPGMSFLSPGDACHHVYQRSSGGYEAAATVTWLAEWAGGGQSGVFTDVDDVCGAAGDDPCASTVVITVEEIQVLGTR